jgi:hypothetical protein
VSPAQAHNILTQLLRDETFRVFVVRTDDGREFEVESPLRVALPAHPSAGHCAVYVGEGLHIIGLDAIASIEVAR